jgi:hypothetical protein
LSWQEMPQTIILLQVITDPYYSNQKNKPPNLMFLQQYEHLHKLQVPPIFREDANLAQNSSLLNLGPIFRLHTIQIHYCQNKLIRDLLL